MKKPRIILCATVALLIALCVTILVHNSKIKVNDVREKVNRISVYGMKRESFESSLFNIIGNFTIISEKKNTRSSKIKALNDMFLKPAYFVTYHHERPHVSVVLMRYGKQGIIVMASYDIHDTLISIRIEPDLDSL